VFIDVRGIPRKVQVEDCPSALHEATVHTLMRWRWYPVVVEGEAVPAQVVMGIQFVP